jgi:hypothetical protein
MAEETGRKETAEQAAKWTKWRRVTERRWLGSQRATGRRTENWKRRETTVWTAEEMERRGTAEQVAKGTRRWQVAKRRWGQETQYKRQWRWMGWFGGDADYSNRPFLPRGGCFLVLIHERWGRRGTTRLQLVGPPLQQRSGEKPKNFPSRWAPVVARQATRVLNTVSIQGEV